MLLSQKNIKSFNIYFVVKNIHIIVVYKCVLTRGERVSKQDNFVGGGSYCSIYTFYYSIMINLLRAIFINDFQIQRSRIRRDEQLTESDRSGQKVQFGRLFGFGIKFTEKGKASFFSPLKRILCDSGLVKRDIYIRISNLEEVVKRDSSSSSSGFSRLCP